MPHISDQGSVGRFLFLFLVFVLFASFVQVTPWVDDKVVTPYLTVLAEACGWIIRSLGKAVIVTGDTIHDPTAHNGIRIDNGCSGIEAAVLLGSAILAFPVNGFSRLAGVFFGISVILITNVLRVISLFYLLQYSRELFDWAHLFLWDVLIIIDGMLVFFVWARWARARAHD